MAKATHTFNEENIKYLRGFLGDNEVETFIRVHALDRASMEEYLKTNPEECAIHDIVEKHLEQMEKFGDNRWWINEDKKVLAYYQFISPLLLVTFREFANDLTILLGRPVWSHEMALNYEGLKREVERAFNGTQDSDEQKAESIKKSFEQLADLGKNL